MIFVGFDIPRNSNAELILSTSGIQFVTSSPSHLFDDLNKVKDTAAQRPSAIQTVELPDDYIFDVDSNLAIKNLPLQGKIVSGKIVSRIATTEAIECSAIAITTHADLELDTVKKILQGKNRVIDIRDPAPKSKEIFIINSCTIDEKTWKG